MKDFFEVFRSSAFNNWFQKKLLFSVSEQTFDLKKGKHFLRTGNLALTGNFVNNLGQCIALLLNDLLEVKQHKNFNIHLNTSNLKKNVNIADILRCTFQLSKCVF